MRDPEPELELETITAEPEVDEFAEVDERTVAPADTLPYLIGTTGSGNYAYYPSGAIRRLTGNVELQRLRDELGVRTLGLSGTDAENAEACSSEVFGL